MNLESELAFYIATCVSAALIILTAVDSAKKENDRSLKLKTWLLPTTGVLISFITGSAAHMQANRDQDTIQARNTYIRKQFANVKDSTHMIIDSLDSALIHTRNLIVQNSSIISKQQSSLRLIGQGLNSTLKIKSLTDTLNIRTAYAAAENLQTGELKINFTPAASKIVHVHWGGITSDYTFRDLVDGASPIRVGDEEPIKLKYSKNRLLMTMRVYDLNGNLIAEIEDNYWRLNRNYVSKINYDNTGFEVIDNTGRVALSIDIQKDNYIIIRGILRFPLAKINLVMGNFTMGQIPFKSQEFEAELQSTKGITYEDFIQQIMKSFPMTRLFKYTGKDWLHKRV